MEKNDGDVFMVANVSADDDIDDVEDDDLAGENDDDDDDSDDAADADDVVEEDGASSNAAGGRVNKEAVGGERERGTCRDRQHEFNIGIRD